MSASEFSFSPLLPIVIVFEFVPFDNPAMSAGLPGATDCMIMPRGSFSPNALAVSRVKVVPVNPRYAAEQPFLLYLRVRQS